MVAQGLEVLAGIGLVEPAGLDDTQEEVADFGSPLGLEGERVFAVENCEFQGPLGDIMPTAGLCRVEVGILAFPRQTEIPVMAHAA